MTKETKSTLIRLGLAIMLIIATGLVIYYVNPTEKHDAKNTKNDEIEKKSDFVISIPEIKRNNDSSDLKNMKQKAQDIHQQMNDIADQDGFNGASLEDKDISKQLKEVNRKLDSIKREKNNTPEFNAHIEHMQELVEASLNGSARSMATLYGYVSGLDKKLNDTKALVDAIEISDYLTDIKNDSSLKEVKQWIEKVNQEVNAGKLNEINLKDYDAVSKEKREEAEKYLKDTKEQANKYSETIDSDKLEQQLTELEDQLNRIQNNKVMDDEQLKSLKETLEKLEQFNNRK